MLIASDFFSDESATHDRMIQSTMFLFSKPRVLLGLGRQLNVCHFVSPIDSSLNADSIFLPKLTIPSRGFASTNRLNVDSSESESSHIANSLEARTLYIPSTSLFICPGRRANSETLDSREPEQSSESEIKPWFVTCTLSAEFMRCLSRLHMVVGQNAWIR